MPQHAARARHTNVNARATIPKSPASSLSHQIVETSTQGAKAMNQRSTHLPICTGLKVVSGKHGSASTGTVSKAIEQ